MFNYILFFLIIPIFFFIGLKIGYILTDLIIILSSYVLFIIFLPSEYPTHINEIDIVNYTVPIENNCDKCIICFDTLEESKVCKMKNCIHIFHKECIKNWLNIKHNCPTCRTSINKLQFF